MLAHQSCLLRYMLLKHVTAEQLSNRSTIRGQSRISLSKSSELASSQSSISVCIAFLLFLASSVCIMQAMPSKLFKDNCNYESYTHVTVCGII